MMTCQELHQSMQKIFAMPGYTYMQEVRDATGFDAVRTADAIAVGMYRSRGLLMHGFEMKVSRTDWLKELTQPEKAESWMRFCHHWSLVISDASFVHEGELPDTWGLYAPVKGKMKCIKRPPMLDPAPITMKCLTALIYGANCAANGLLQTRIDAALEEDRKRRMQSQMYELDQLRKMSERVKEFQEASGINLGKHSWECPKAMGEAVKALMAADNVVKYRVNTLASMIRDITEVSPVLQKHHDALQALLPKETSS